MATQTFPFRFDTRYRVLLAGLGITPSTALVIVGDGRFRARFGPWWVRTSLDNVEGTESSGPYTWYRVIGPHLSFADRGMTMGTNAERGLCIRFRQPVRGLDPVGLLRHPGLTVTVDDIDGLAAALGPYN